MTHRLDMDQPSRRRHGYRPAGDQAARLARAGRLDMLLNNLSDRAVPGRGARRAGGAGRPSPRWRERPTRSPCSCCSPTWCAWCWTWATRCASTTCCGSSSRARRCRWGPGASRCTRSADRAPALSLWPARGQDSNWLRRVLAVVGRSPRWAPRRTRGSCSAPPPNRGGGRAGWAAISSTRRCAWAP